MKRRRGRGGREIGIHVQCVTQIKTTGVITDTSTQSCCAYRGGYYGRFDREFHGSGMVEQWDAEASNAQKRVLFRSPPVLTKTRFYTGAIEIPTMGYFHRAARP